MSDQFPRVFFLSCLALCACGSPGTDPTDAGTESDAGVLILPTAKAVQLVTGTGFACARTEDKALRCWGTAGSVNDYMLFARELGYDDNVRITAPIEIMTGVEDVAADYRHLCAVMTGGTVKCWGEGSSGKLGNGDDRNSTTPVQVTGITNAKKVVVGFQSSCALLTTGALKCWGADNAGQLLGQTSPSRPSSLVPVDMPGFESGVLDVALNYEETCAIMSDHTAKCWGNVPTAGVTGDAPYLVPLPNITAISPGRGTMCAVSNGAVKCWGDADEARLGDGSEGLDPDAVTPVEPTGLGSGATDIDSACAVKDAHVYCWGQRSALGDGQEDGHGSRVPVKIDGIEGATHIDMQWDSFSCALTGTGSVYCWGDNYWGNVGVGFHDSENADHFYRPQKVLSFP